MDTAQLKKEFPQPPDLIYLNHAAVAPWPTRTAHAVISFAQENTEYGAKHYEQWCARETTLKHQLQGLINAPSVDDIALLKNTSEALSVVATGIDWQEGDNIVTSNEEFPSNRIPWEAQKELGVVLREINIHRKDPEQALISACDERTRLLTISSVQFGSGIRLDLEVLGKFCKENNILFCVDAIQSIGAHRIDVQAIQADFVMADGHKWMLGPEGIALFYCASKARPQIQLHQYGWHMVEDAGNFDTKSWQPAASARRFESGSPNMLGIHALSASLSLLEEIGMETVEKQILKNSSYLIDKLNNIDGITVRTPESDQHHAGIISFTTDTIDMAIVHKHLLDNNVICAHRGGGLRFSPHFYTPREKLDKALSILEACVRS